MRSVAILGTRGIPAAHGGFETFAERLALHLVDRGWSVSVYCQPGDGVARSTDVWNGVQRVHIPTRTKGSLATIEYDLLSTWCASRVRPGVVLTLGYNTALFCAMYRLLGIPNVINMDGLEWRRAKWSPPVRLWFYLNERLGCRLGNVLVADHPQIQAHLETRVHPSRIVMIPYGADALHSASQATLALHGLQPDKYAILIARPEPENTVREIVAAFSRRPRGIKLVVLGDYAPERNNYHRDVMRVASGEVMFLGAIYDKAHVDALRYFCRVYLHGHRVGGTNPSLVEALGAGNAILAHDNRFNRWVAGTGARYFSNEEDCALGLDEILDERATLDAMRVQSRVQQQRMFKWETVLDAYEHLLRTCHDGRAVPR